MFFPHEFWRIWKKKTGPQEPLLRNGFGAQADHDYEWIQRIVKTLLAYGWMDGHACLSDRGNWVLALHVSSWRRIFQWWEWYHKPEQKGEREEEALICQKQKEREREREVGGSDKAVNLDLSRSFPLNSTLPPPRNAIQRVSRLPHSLARAELFLFGLERERRGQLKEAP